MRIRPNVPRSAGTVALVTCAAVLAGCGDLGGVGPVLPTRVPSASDDDVGVRWSTSGRALAGAHWLGPDGIAALDCDDRTGWDELATLEVTGGALPPCGRPRADRPLLCQPGGSACLRVGTDAIVLAGGARETRLLDVRPEDVRPFAPRNGEELVFQVGQRDASGAPERSTRRYGAQVLRTYRFSFAIGELEEISDGARADPRITHLGHGVQTSRRDGAACVGRQGHLRCWPRVSAVVALADGALVVIPSASGSGSIVLRLDPSLEDRFRTGALGGHGAVRVVPRADGTVLVTTTSEARLLDASTGAELRRFPMHTQYDERTHATGEVLSTDGTRLFSCARDALVVRAAETGRIENRFAGTCAVDDEGEARSAPLPSPNGRFSALLCTGGTPCLVRARDGTKLVLEAGLSSARVRSFFEGSDPT